MLLISYRFLTARKLAEKDGLIPDEDLPFVSLIITAYNEEKSIKNKIENFLSLDYPKDKIEIIVASDCSDDRTDEIVKEYSDRNSLVRLVRTEQRAGKVRAQDEAVNTSKYELLVFSDANNLWAKDALINLVKCAQAFDTVCVCGKLVYINEAESGTSSSEGMYWRIENKMKELESKFYSITALNGGIYLVKRTYYVSTKSSNSHDLYFPLVFGKNKKRTLYCSKAIAYERSCTNLSDEKKRKVRMFGGVYKSMFENPGLFFNPVGYAPKFFISVFLHRAVRYLLPFLHLIVFITNILLLKQGLLYELVFIMHLVFLILALFGVAFKSKLRIPHFLFYYLFFLSTMLLGFWKFLKGEVKPYWETAGSAR